jgi:hypothetical protein
VKNTQGISFRFISSMTMVIALCAMFAACGGDPELISVSSAVSSAGQSVSGGNQASVSGGAGESANNGGSSTGTSSAPGVPGTSTVFISEIALVGTSGNNKYIELYNPNGTAFNLSGWALAVHVTSADAKPAAGNTSEGSYLYQFGAGVTIPAGGTYVLANAGASARVLSAAAASGVTITYAQTTAGGRIVSFTQNQRVALYNGNTVVDRVPAASTGAIGADRVHMRKPGFGPNAVYTAAEWTITTPGVDTDAGRHTFASGSSSSSLSPLISSSSSSSRSSGASSSSSSQGVMPVPPQEEGIYVGIIKFDGNATDLTGGAPVRLDSATRTTLITSLSNQYVISAQAGTAMFYGVHMALANLKRNEAGYSANLGSVNVVTFTDGLDNASDGRSAFTPIENKEFNSPSAYASYISTEIANRRIAEKVIDAYSVGVKGDDVTDITGFQNNLASIATAATPPKWQQLTDFADVQAVFNAIADGLNITPTQTSFNLITPLLSPGTRVRMTFDISSTDPANVASSAKYIEGVINRTGQVYTFTEITYSGMTAAVGAGPITGTVNGSEISFAFNTVTGYNPAADKTLTKQWLMFPGSANWQNNSEYNSDGSSTSIVYLVLDCSTSLKTAEIAQIRTAAISFINSLYTRSSGSLLAGIWANGTLAAGGVQYTLNVTSGTTYRIWWNDSSQGNGSKTANVMVNARYASGTAIFSNVDNGWTTAQSFTASSTGTVTVTVTGYGGATSGTFGIAYSTSTLRPSL